MQEQETQQETGMVQPTVFLVIGESAITRDERGEIIETVEWLESGRPDWSAGGMCDHRGGGGAEGFRLLGAALEAAEENARMVGFEVTRLPEDALS